jgi:hypothetical protein
MTKIVFDFVLFFWCLLLCSTPVPFAGSREQSKVNLSSNEPGAGCLSKPIEWAVNLWVNVSTPEDFVGVDLFRILAQTRYARLPQKPPHTRRGSDI